MEFRMTDLPADAGGVLTRMARAAIVQDLGGGPTTPGDREAWLAQQGAVFVTLTIAGELRGCIGSLEAWRSLHDDVTSNARAAAFRDPRFPPVSREEMARVAVEVSVLSAPEPMAFASEAEALAELRPGVDGVILAAAGRRATFLPQVWEQLAEPPVFLAHLKRKAGLPGDYWGSDVELWRYTVTAFAEDR
jgi:AmmeMemoRadiSam system protein A